MQGNIKPSTALQPRNRFPGKFIVAILPRAQQGSPTDNSPGGKITIIAATDEVGLRSAGHLGQAMQTRHNGASKPLAA